LLISSFNGKPQASLPYFAYACGSPLNENTQYGTESTLSDRHAAHSVHVIAHNFPRHRVTLSTLTETIQNTTAPFQSRIHS
jgi:hypothetical protein